MTLLGLPLDEAKKRLGSAACEVIYLENKWETQGDLRVIKQIERDGVTVLTVTLFAKLREGENDA